MSVANVSQVQATFCATLVDEWIRAGLRDVVVCPGSRSTPLTMAMHARGELQLHIRIDERSAAFFALGRALASERPVAIVVTSGTAAAEVHAAVAEADLSAVPLLVLTADRPPHLHGVGAPQTIEQRSLFGAKVRAFVEPGVARDEHRKTWRPLAARIWRTARGLDGVAPGPVHVNLAFDEPLMATPGPLPEGRADGELWTFAPATPAVRSALAIAGQRVLCIVGAGVRAPLVQELWSAGWAIIGDATAPHTLPYADPLLRSDAWAKELQPDVVVRIGGLVSSKVVNQRLVDWQVRVIAFTGAGPVADPDGVITDRLPGLPDVHAAQLRGDNDYVQLWARASRDVGERLGEVDHGPLSEITLARAVVEASVSHGVALVLGSSMPIRDVEWWAPSRATPVYANRGANGIDGVVSTMLGVASGQQALGLVGDVTFLHDVSALVDGGTAETSAVLVVVDNAGGGIFNFLPPAVELPKADFEALFATPRPHDLVAIAQAFSHHAERVSTVEGLRQAITEGLHRRGVSVIVAQVPEREQNVLLHAALNEEVARCRQ